MEDSSPWLQDFLLGLHSRANCQPPALLFTAAAQTPQTWEGELSLLVAKSYLTL